jgi:hypothetical protein
MPSFIFSIPFLFISFYFILATNSLLKYISTNKILIVCIVLTIVRGFFCMSCIVLLKIILVFFRIFLLH